MDGNTRTNDLCPVGEASRTGTGPGSAVRVATSAVRRKVRAGGSIRFRLFGGCCRASKRPTVSTRSGASCVRPANAGENSRHGITVAVGEPRWRGQNGQATTPAAHVQAREQFGTEPKETDSSKNVNNNTEGRLWGLQNTDTKNKLQLKLGEMEASRLRTFQKTLVTINLQAVTNQRYRSAP